VSIEARLPNNNSKLRTTFAAMTLLTPLGSSWGASSNDVTPYIVPGLMRGVVVAKLQLPVELPPAALPPGGSSAV